MRFCIFSGTFNPIHNGHLLMAEHILKEFDVNKIIFIPAFVPPQKDFQPELAKHRFNMVEMAVNKNPQFEVSDIEFKMKGKSYTYNTIQELYKKLNIKGKIKFVIGTDAFENLDTWYKSEELRKIVEFIVFPRKNNFVKENYKYMEEKGYNFEFANMQFNDISSTDIRNRIKNNQSITGLVPEDLERYIKENGIYKS